MIEKLKDDSGYISALHVTKINYCELKNIIFNILLILVAYQCEI